MKCIKMFGKFLTRQHFQIDFSDDIENHDIFRFYQFLHTVETPLKHDFESSKSVLSLQPHLPLHQR